MGIWWSMYRSYPHTLYSPYNRIELNLTIYGRGYDAWKWERLNVMGIRNIINYKIRGVPLWVIGACGLAGVLVDIDHLIPSPIKEYPFQWLHVPLAIVSCLILFGIGACCGGFYLKYLLKKDPNKNQISRWCNIKVQLIPYWWGFKIIKTWIIWLRLSIIGFPWTVFTISH